jgi:glycosyltransferase involved in cell wall biosynthesis
MQNGKLCVMQIILNLDIGGAQEVVRTLVEYLASDTCMPVVCSFEDGPLRQDIERLGIKVEVLPQRQHSILAFPLYAADMMRIRKSLAALVAKYHVDIVQTHLLMSLDFLVLLLLYTTDLRAVLWTFHNSSFELDASMLPRHKWLLGPKKLAYRLLYRWASHLVSGYIAISEQVAKAITEIIGPIGDKVTVINNGVDVKRYGQPGKPRLADKPLSHQQPRPADDTPPIDAAFLPARARTIVMVGRLTKQKGHHFMIESMASLAAQYPDLHLLLVGDGELRDELQMQVAELGLHDRVRFLGNRHDVPVLLAASDIFVLPSLWEGLSMALLEAMASGLPVVASAVSGSVQAVLPGETGLLVPAGDVPELTKAISQLLDDPVRAQAMGVAAKRRVELEFSARKQADEHLALYRRLMADQKNPLQDRKQKAGNRRPPRMGV